MSAPEKDKAVTEGNLQNTILQIARLFGWLAMHTRPAQRADGSWSTPLQGDPGFPDLTLARRGTVRFVEVKTATGRLFPDQESWALALLDRPYDPDLRQPTDLYQVWRPQDLSSGYIEGVLR